MTKKQKQTNDTLQDDLRVFVAPVDIFEIEGLSIYEKMAYIVIRSHCNARGNSAFPSYTTIAKEGSMSRRKAIDAVAGLLTKGLLHKEIRGTMKDNKFRNTSNLYTLQNPSKIKAKQQLEKEKGSAQHAPPSAQCALPSAQHAPEHNQLTESINMIDDKARARESINLTFEEWANNRDLPVEITKDIKALITKEKISFDMDLFNDVLDKSLPRYTAGKINAFAPYFVSVLKKEREKRQLSKVAAAPLKPKNKRSIKKVVPEYIWLQVERDRQEEKQREQMQLSKNPEEFDLIMQETEQLIKELGARTN